MSVGPEIPRKVKATASHLIHWVDLLRRKGFSSKGLLQFSKVRAKTKGT